MDRSPECPQWIESRHLAKPLIFKPIRHAQPDCVGTGLLLVARID